MMKGKNTRRCIGCLIPLLAPLGPSRVGRAMRCRPHQNPIAADVTDGNAHEFNYGARRRDSENLPVLPVARTTVVYSFVAQDPIAVDRGFERGGAGNVRGESPSGLSGGIDSGDCFRASHLLA